MKIVSRRGQDKRKQEQPLPVLVQDHQLTQAEADHIQEVFKRIRKDLQDIFDPKGLSNPKGSPCQRQP